jgi:hypothetical protein
LNERRNITFFTKTHRKSLTGSKNKESRKTLGSTRECIGEICPHSLKIISSYTGIFSVQKSQIRYLSLINKTKVKWEKLTEGSLYISQL